MRCQIPEESSLTTAHLFDAMTTTYQVQSTAANTVTSPSSSSHGADFYFQSAVVVIGIVGAAANVLILYAILSLVLLNLCVIINLLPVRDIAVTFLRVYPQHGGEKQLERNYITVILCLKDDLRFAFVGACVIRHVKQLLIC